MTDARPCHRALPDAEATAEILLRPDRDGPGTRRAHGRRPRRARARRGPRRSHGKRSLAFGAPQQPGVYLFRDAHDQVLYVGKARDLRARLRSYFRSDRQRPAVEAALGALARIEWRVIGSELEAALEELRLIRELRPPANARSARPDRYVYLRRRGDTVVCSAHRGRSGRSRVAGERSSLRARCRASTGRRSTTPLPKLREKLRRLARRPAVRGRRAPPRPDRSARAGRRARSPGSSACAALAVCVVAPDGEGRGRRGFFVAKGQVVCVRPFHGAHGVEWQAGLAAVARAEPSLAPEAADELLVIAGVPAAPAARARGRAFLHSPGMDELRERGAGDGWRKLVADGVTATPVTLRRGAAVKLVDGAHTEIVPRADWPARLDALLADARNVHLLSPDGDVHARRTKTRQLARLARSPLVAGGHLGPSRPRAAAPAADGPPAVRGDEDLARQGAAGAALRRVAARAAALGARADPRRRRRLRQGVHEPGARRVRARGRARGSSSSGSTRTPA